MSDFDLPKGWLLTSLGEIADWGSGGTPSRTIESYYGGTIPWVKTGDLGPKVLKQASEFITEQAVANSSAKFFPKGSVAIAMYGATIGKTSILGIDATTNQACGVGNPIKGVTFTEFLYYMLCNEKDNFIAKGKGGAQPNISQALIKEHEIALPPLAEQKQIAQKLDELLAQVDTLKTRLDAIPKILKRFRQSVLAAAVSGRLTEGWRETNKLKNVEKNEILTNRKDSWEVEELRKMKILGKSPINDKWKSRYKPANDVLDENCFSIPSTWCWSNIGELTYSVKDGPHFSPKYEITGIPFISGGNIRTTGIDFSNTKFISLELHEELSKRCKPEIGDILYTKGGTTGIAYLNNESREFNVWVHVAVLKLTEKVSGMFFQNALNSKHCYDQSQSYTHGVGNQDLGLTRLVNITVPVPPLAEQTEIVRRVEQLFAYADQIEQRVKDAQARVNHLTQSILAKAFRGELTAEWRAQNPELISGGNSAAALLERIKAEREVTAKPKKKVRA